MKRRILFSSLILAVLAAVCVAHGAAPSATPAAAPPAAPLAAAPSLPDLAQQHGLSLAMADNTVDLSTDETVDVLLEGQQLSMNGAPVGSVAEIIKKQRLQRLDDLFIALKAYREAWKTAHPSVDFPGVLLLWLDENTPVLTAKSIFQTAAFAGYPNLSFAVHPRLNPAALARVNADAFVPAPPDSEHVSLRDPFTFHVHAEPGHDLTLEWKLSGKAIRTASVAERAELGATAFPLLAKRATDEWIAHGGHRTSYDRAFDQAFVHVANELTVKTLIALMDAVCAPTRDFEWHDENAEVPSFNITLPVN